MVGIELRRDVMFCFIKLKGSISSNNKILYKMNTKQIAIAVGSGVAAAGLAYLIYKKLF